MIKPSLFERHCQLHKEKINSCCLNLNCNQNRLVCFDCLTVGQLHIGHLSCLKKIDTVEEILNQQNQQCSNLIAQLSKMIEEILNTFYEFRNGIEAKYNLSIERINKLSNDQINQYISNIIQFDKQSEEMKKKIEDICSGFLNKLKNLVIELQLDELNYVQIKKENQEKADELHKEGQNKQMGNVHEVNQQNLSYGLKQFSDGFYRCDQLPGYFRMSNSDPNKCYYVQENQEQAVTKDNIQIFIENTLQQNDNDKQIENGSQNIQQNLNQENNENIVDQQSTKQEQNEMGEKQLKQDQQINKQNNNTTDQERNGGSLIQFENQDIDKKIDIEECESQQQLPKQPAQKAPQSFDQAQADEERNYNLYLQQLTYQQKQQLQEIQYYVYQDLANMLGVLTDATETLKHFEGQTTKDYVPIVINRMVLQANLSNGIHFDCGFNFNSQVQKEMYWKEKQNASRIFDKFYQQINIKNDEKLKECVELFKYNLTQKPELKQLAPLKVEPGGGITQNSVQKIFDGMNEANQMVDRIKKGEYQKFSEKDFEGIVKARGERAQKLLNQNFPQKEKHQDANQLVQDHR